MKESEYIYSPTIKEVRKAMWQQATVCLNFSLNPNMSIKEYGEEIGKALAPIKDATDTQKYSLEKLKKLSEQGENKRLKRFYEHESRHARQMEKALTDMGIDMKPKFNVYICPIMADHNQAGAWVGLIDLYNFDKLHFDRKQMQEFNIRTTYQMLGTFDNSVGDVLLASSVLLGNALHLFKG
ncbi:MAG TPA: hypothetical protein VKC54_03215 [Patescibacteria group bacterium]|nr:hypothetical protein [Patescibacteria group bacterium]